MKNQNQYKDKRKKNRNTISKGYRELNHNYGDIFVTISFVRDIQDIYGNFKNEDLEYPAMGITIDGAPIFIECLRYPDSAIIRRRFTDEVRGDNPAVRTLWNKTLKRHNGKCRYASVHIHPMDLPRPSGIDIKNYEQVRTNQTAPNTFPNNKPFPIILINLHEDELQILSFWVFEGSCCKADTVYVADDDPRVTAAWAKAKPLSFFSDEARCVENVQRIVSPKWRVTLGEKNDGSEKAMLIQDTLKNRSILKFDRQCALGLGHPLMEDCIIIFEDYVDWESLFEDLIAVENSIELERCIMEKQTEEQLCTKKEGKDAVDRKAASEKKHKKIEIKNKEYEADSFARSQNSPRSENTAESLKKEKHTPKNQKAFKKEKKARINVTA